MANIKFVNEFTSASVRVINDTDVINEVVVPPGSTHNGLRLEPGDLLSIVILGGITLPRGCFIELNKDFAWEFSPGDPIGLDPNIIVGNIRTLKIPGPHTPDWELKITNPNGVGAIDPFQEENVTVGENQT
ncbi:MAG: hypothetical protein JSV88_11945 [Candidatus Aminicenantes bacterium]|nr:MAG: hypothetical protein JSV88_11945 [Candidatus Aminicenantes bacterium]